MAKLIIGIDFSKEKMNFCCMDAQNMSILLEGAVENSRQGCGKMTKQLRGLQKGLRCRDFLFCGENTGIYSLETAECLTSRKYFVWLENPLQLKLSSGIRRSKTDTLDARMIAEYACRHLDKAKRFSPCGEGLKKLRELHLTRRKLKDCEVALKNFSGSLSKESLPASKALRKVMESIKESIRTLEKEIREQLLHEPEFRENASLALTVPGISWVTASAIILDTRNFTRFSTARQYASAPQAQGKQSVKQICKLPTHARGEFSAYTQPTDAGVCAEKAERRKAARIHRQQHTQQNHTQVVCSHKE